MDDVYINIGNNKLPVGTVINVIYNDNSTKEDIILKRATTGEVKNPIIKNDIILIIFLNFVELDFIINLMVNKMIVNKIRFISSFNIK